jgi:hypothetical protein
MSEDSRSISAEMMDFIRTSLKSVWALELLLLMRKWGARRWTVAELTRELRASELLVYNILREFVETGLVVETTPETFEYRAATPALDLLVKSLAGIYAQSPVRVIEAIVNAPNKNIQVFADAFNLRKPRK